jgi:hypothetical protein
MNGSQGESRMRIKSNSSSAGEQARPADARRSAKPEKARGKFRRVTPVLGSAAVALGAMALCGGGTAYAGSITQPGETIGYALGAPLPEGVYFATTLSDGGARGIDDKRSGELVNIPVIVWSTPWQIFGARVFGYVAVPEVSLGVPVLRGDVVSGPAGRDYMAMYNPFAAAGLAWDLGGGWGFSDVVGGYGPVDNELRFFGHDVWVFNNRAALSYTGDKWNLTAHVIYGATGNDVQTSQRVTPDYLNIDLTAVKTLGKWSVGPVAYWSTDTENFAYGPGQCGGHNLNVKCSQSQFAAGGWLGYDFTGITTALYATTDVWTDNYRNIDGSKSQETRIWMRAVVPLWTPPAGEKPLK